MAKGCSIARSCWCVYYRHRGAGVPVPAGSTRAQENKAEFKELVDSGAMPGLIGYRDGVPVGWVSVGPRKEFLKLERSPVMKPVDELPVWSIICFVVPAAYRSQGVAAALLDGAVEFSRSNGALAVEGYPIDKPKRSNDEFMWFGAKSMFDRAGFVEVARRKPQRPVMRLLF